MYAVKHPAAESHLVNLKACACSLGGDRQMPLGGLATSSEVNPANLHTPWEYILSFDDQEEQGPQGCVTMGCTCLWEGWRNRATVRWVGP